MRFQRVAACSRVVLAVAIGESFSVEQDWFFHVCVDTGGGGLPASAHHGQLDRGLSGENSGSAYAGVLLALLGAAARTPAPRWCAGLRCRRAGGAPAELVLGQPDE